MREIDLKERIKRRILQEAVDELRGKIEEEIREIRKIRGEIRERLRMMELHERPIPPVQCPMCLKDPNVCPRGVDAMCLICGVMLCGYHIGKHLEEEHLVSLTWRGLLKPKEKPPKQ